MWREEQVQDNWALLHSQGVAMQLRVPLHVAFCVPITFREMTLRHYTFMLEGLKEEEEELMSRNIGFHLMIGEPHICINREFLSSLDIGLIVTDFSPLREHRAWISMLLKSLSDYIVMHQVDAHNVVPVWATSNKEE